MDKKLVCRGLGSDKWVEADHLSAATKRRMTELFDLTLNDSIQYEGITLIETTDSSGGVFEYRMDYHTNAEREALLINMQNIQDD